MVFWEIFTRLPISRRSCSTMRDNGKQPRRLVYSRNLAEPRSTRTRIVRTFDSDEVRQLKADAERDLTVDGPGLAAHGAVPVSVDEASHVLLYA